MNTLNELSLEDLRTERHRLSEEVARLSWLRRLVMARRDLEIARLVGMEPAPGELPDDVRDALGPPAGGLTSETLQHLAACVRSLGAAADAAQAGLDDATRELVERYIHDPSRCLPAVRR